MSIIGFGSMRVETMKRIVIILSIILAIFLCFFVFYDNGLKQLNINGFGRFCIPDEWTINKTDRGIILDNGKKDENSNQVYMVELEYKFENGEHYYTDISNNKVFTIEYMNGSSLNNEVKIHTVRIQNNEGSYERYMLEIWHSVNGIMEVRDFLFDESIDVDTIKKIGRSFWGYN
jgi:hypothetical protein